MHVVDGHANLPQAQRGAVLAIGNFDGVHVGHRQLLTIAAALASARGCAAGVLTFTPHPLAVLAPAAAPRSITSAARQLELLAAAGCQLVVREPFTHALAAMSADAFVEDVLVRGLGVAGVVVGPDFRFGHGRGGNVAALRTLGAQHGVAVEVVEPVVVDGAPASSSRIRTALVAHDLATARTLLGRRWDVDGVVVHGAKRGREIGVPTANVATQGDVLVPLGIYAVRLLVDGRTLDGVASLGTNPTFVVGGPAVLEVHVLDFDGDLYDRLVRVQFVAYLRGEQRYDSIDALLTQIRLDIDHARVELRSRT